MRMGRGVSLLVALLITAVTSASRAETPGFAFLEVPVGARGASMGGAYTSVTTGPDAAFWIPAALTGVSGLQVSATHVEFLGNLRHEQFALASRKFGGVLAGAVRGMYSEAIDQRDDLGNLTGTFGSHDLEFRLAYGHRVTDELSLGGSAQVLRERLEDESATTYAFGMSSVYEPRRLGGLRLAAIVDQLGPAAHYTIGGTPGDDVTLPAALQVGASYARTAGAGLTWRGALESRMVRGRTGVAMLGGEITHAPSGMSLRAGWRVSDAQSPVAFGAGFARSALSVDYAFVPFSDELGDTHRFSLGARF
jgi:hypothetical protein